MTEIRDAVIAFFEEEGWVLHKTSEQLTFQAIFQGKHGQWLCHAEVREAQGQFLFYSICPTPAPEACRPALSEFLTRANYGLVIGNFEMDLDDGEIRFKSSLDAQGEPVSPGLIQHLVYPNLLMMDRYLPGIMRIIYEQATPAEVLAALDDPASNV